MPNTGKKRGAPVQHNRKGGTEVQQPKKQWVVKTRKDNPTYLERKTKTHALETTPPEQRGQELARELGASGTDPRAAIVQKKNAVTSETVANANATVNPMALMPFQNLANLCLGIVLFSIEKGWLSTPAPDPYAAYLYLFASFSNALTGTIPEISSAPMWFWIIIHALLPKNHRFKQATASYTWDASQVTGAAPPSPVTQYNNMRVVLGVINTGNVNGYPTITIASTPTVAEQQLAIQQLFKFYTDKALCKQVSGLPENHWIRHDISAFAMSYDEGEASNAAFGQYCTAYLESPLQCPLLAQFAPYQQQGAGLKWRASLFTRRVSGTPAFIIPRLTEFESANEIKNKQFPIIKYFDFWEFFEVLSMIIGGALEYANQVGSALVIGPCPLSAQNVQILLRQALMNVFDNAKMPDFAAGSGQGLVAYSVFSAGANGVALTQNVGNMQLPQVFSENVRACKRKSIILRNKQVLDFIPLLCQPTKMDNTGNQNLSGGYTFFNGIADANQSIYTPLVGEVRINLVDGSYGPVTPTGYVSFEGEQYTTYLSMWNQWFTSLSSYLSGVTQIGTEQGCKAMSVLFNTVIESQILENSDSFKKNPKRKSVPPPVSLGARLLIDKHDVMPDPNQLPLSNYYEGVGINNFTSNATFVASVWKYVKLFIMPICHSQTMFYAGSTGYYQMSMCEPYRIDVGSNYSGDLASDETTVTAYQRHLELAKVDIKQQLSAKSEFSVELEELLKQGEGGVFAAIAGSIANMFIPGSGGIVNKIGSDLGL